MKLQILTKVPREYSKLVDKAREVDAFIDLLNTYTCTHHRVFINASRYSKRFKISNQKKIPKNFVR